MSEIAWEHDCRTCLYNTEPKAKACEECRRDLVEVVRCKDCKHRDPEDHKCDSGALERAGCMFPVGDDYFCAWGERREDEAD